MYVSQHRGAGIQFIWSPDTDVHLHFNTILARASGGAHLVPVYDRRRYPGP
jgi:hypothetical protein